MSKEKENEDIDMCPLASEDVRKVLSLEQCTSRKRDSSMSAHQCPSGKRISIGVPAPNVVMMKNSEAVTKSTLVKTKGFYLSITEIVGEQFDVYIKDIWSCLMDGDSVFRVGIHGIGGVGKTQVAKSINNKLLQNPNKFNHVFWVNVSPDSTLSPPLRVRDLQSSISKAVGLHLSDGDDESKRAAQLTKGFAEKKKFVLILDDVWDYISLQEVGVPEGVDGCTVLFTTRSLGVCRQLGCQRTIEIKCLPPVESYELFKKNLGKETTLSREVEEISRLVADKCVGLPLAITIMATNMKGLTDKGTWRNALRGQMRKKADMEIFAKLKISYDYLKDATLQHCFLYCSLLVEAYRGKRRLAEYLVDEGIIKRMNRRREELDEAHAMLDLLCDAGLLEIASPNSVKMNKLIQSMALQIMEESQQLSMIKKGMSLKDLPDEDSWTEDLVRVSLERSQVENIPPNYSPSCSRLSTLLLSQNYKLRCIGDSFFERMPALKVLDLSDTSIESLPPSVCGLVNLTTLLLSRCLQLKNIPSVAELKALKKLDLRLSGVKKVPEDIESLLKLTYLDLSSTEIVEINSAILENLSHVQFLRLPWSSAVKGEPVARLGRLETLTCSFYDAVELNKYLIHLKGGFKEREPPIQLCVQAGGPHMYYSGFANDLLYDEYDEGVFAEEVEDWSSVGLRNCNINEAADMLNYFQDIVIVKCDEARSLCDFSPIKGATELKHFSIQECDGLEFLCSLSSTGQAILENIECMELFRLKNLSVLIRKEGDIAYGSSCFSNLTRFLIEGCPNMKWLFPIHLVPNLKNLQRLYVIDCPLMEEIIGAEEEEESEKRCRLPMLSILLLEKLPELKGICGGGMICVLPEGCSLEAQGCPKMKTDTGH